MAKFFQGELGLSFGNPEGKTEEEERFPLQQEKAPCGSAEIVYNVTFEMFLGSIYKCKRCKQQRNASFCSGCRFALLRTELNSKAEEEVVTRFQIRCIPF